MPDDVAQEKVNALQALGADVQRVRPASIVDKKQVRAHIIVTILFIYQNRVTVCGEQFLCRGKSCNEHSQICKKNIARRAAIEFGRSDIAKGLEDAHTNHELHTGSASVVVTTTSSHVNAEGTIDDPLDEDLLSKPRGFFADQFEVLALIDKC
jgi:cysteine synthase A